MRDAIIKSRFRTELLTELAVNNTVKKGNLTASADFNALYENGIYACNLKRGEGGAGAPPVQELGVLEVETVEDLVIQRFTGADNFMQRIFNGTSWSEWKMPN